MGSSAGGSRKDSQNGLNGHQKQSVDHAQNSESKKSPYTFDAGQKSPENSHGAASKMSLRGEIDLKVEKVPEAKDSELPPKTDLKAQETPKSPSRKISN